MFTTVQQIIGLARPREAENADTRMGMNRRVDEQGKRQNFPEHQKDNQTFYDYEQNTVSVQSALLFLEGFLEARLDAVFREESRDTDSAYAPWLRSDTSNQNVSFATRAYRHAAEISQKFQRTDRAADTDKASELKLIYQLIHDLRGLLDSGIEYIRIESGESFLEAISDSISRIKAA